MGKPTSPQAAHPYQGPSFGLQDNLLSAAVIGNMIGSNPGLAGLLGQGQGNQDQAALLGLGPMLGGYRPQQQSQYFNQSSYPSMGKTVMGIGPNAYGSGSGLYSGMGQMPAYGQGGQTLRMPSNMSGANMLSMFAPQGFQQAGQYIPGQMFSNTTIGTPSQTTGYGDRFNEVYRNFQFSNPNVNFTQRNPYQFQDPNYNYDIPTVNVGDIYTPQMDIASRAINKQTELTREQMLADLNARGMLTSGATNQAMYRLNNDRDSQLANLASQYSLGQAQAQTQEDQMRRALLDQRAQFMANQDWQRQVAQAEEIFRQQGASDEQARFLAQQAVGTQQAQAAQNLAGYQARQSGFNTNLNAQQQQYAQALANAQLLMGQQGQAFTQGLQGRAQATAEEQLANAMRRQPLEDLMAIWKQQAGQTGATEGSAGFLGPLGSILGAGVSALPFLI